MKHKPYLDMLMAREQLMEDIDSIIECFWDASFAHGKYLESRDTLTRKLCDAVCEHFPTPTPD